MGWFDEQIRGREQADQITFEDSFRKMAGAVMGHSLSDENMTGQQMSMEAITQILNFYHVQYKEPPKTDSLDAVLDFLLRPSGIMYRAVTLSGGWYKDCQGAMIGKRTDDGNLVALIPSKLHGYYFYDIKTEKNVKLSSKTEGMIMPQAVAFYRPFPLRQMKQKDLMRYILEQITAGDIWKLILAAVPAVFTGMLLPEINSIFFGSVLESKSNSMLIAAGVFMLCATISNLLFTTIKTMLTSGMGLRLNQSVEAATMMRVLTLPASFFKKYSTGELSTRIMYLTGICSTLVNLIFTIVLTIIPSFVYIWQIRLYAPALTAPALCFTLATIVIVVIQAAMQMNVNLKKNMAASRESGMSLQLISGIQKIRLAGAEKRAFAKWGAIYSEEAALEYNPPIFIRIAPVLTTAISLLGTMVMYVKAVESGVSSADYFAFCSAYGMVTTAISEFAATIPTIAEIRPAMKMADPILETEPEIASEKPMITRLSGGIEVSNITFRYTEDMPPVLDNVSLRIRPGQYVAIVGGTGCGKSTLMRLLLGFEKPQKGAVYYDGHDLNKIDLKSLRQKIGTVLQDGKLFSGSIYENIGIAAPGLKMEQAWEAAEIAGIADDIRNMPMGMHTMISEGQGGISGGQRQRILIARAIAPKPKILMFDEATSALDNITQKNVSEALDRMKCTRIVIAHRLSTIRQCDRIIVLDKGHIVEDGSYEDLIKLGGVFKELVDRQRLDNSGFVDATTAF